MAPPPPVNDEDYTGHISYFNYPFSPATDPNDPPILRIWAEIRPYLLSKGYEIPERIQNPFLGGIFYFAKPDHPIPKDGSNAIRATRRRDRAPVILKIVMQPTRELAVHHYLLSPELRDHPQNHTVPIIDEFPFIRRNGEPFLDWMVIVEPALHEMFPYGSLIDLFGQVFVRIRQVFEGLAFMHSNGIAHGDICHQNIYFMSGIEFKDGVPVHPAPPHLVSRAWRPPRFFFLDFGLANAVSRGRRLRTASDGGAIMPPELEESDAALESHTTYDPFAADVYCLGRVINKATAWISLTEPSEIVTYPPRILHLVQSMMHPEPDKRPTAHECLQLFEAEMQIFPRYKLIFPDVPWQYFPYSMETKARREALLSYVCSVLVCFVFGPRGRLY